MASVSAFTNMLEQFMDELIQTFPEEKKLTKYRASLSLLTAANPRSLVTMFMDSVGPFQAEIMAKDESVLTSGKIEFLNSINIDTLWTDELSPATKGAIWQYIQTLMILGTTINSIPQETLAAIEGIADSMVKNGQGGTKDKPVDMNALSGLMSMFGNMNMGGSQ